jgi:tetratricopeptide repeat protein 8
MLSNPDQFINLSRLNFSKYSESPNLSKPLFEYIFYHENDIRNALQLASLATEASQFNDWWWKIQLGKCYYR